MMSVFLHFFILGLYSFGGPAAHIGYFQREFVEKHGWVNQDRFNQAVALCQFLPGPASSQLGMYIGYQRQGYWGALSAFVGFTLPSFALLTALAVFGQHFVEPPIAYQHFIGAAKWLAVIVVADAVLGMGKKNLTCKFHWIIFCLTALWLALTSGLLAQIAPILLAGALGLAVGHRDSGADAVSDHVVNGRPAFRPNWVLLAAFSMALFGLPLLADFSLLALIVNLFYQAGAFVFGGGHVVLPLLEPMLAGLVPEEAFITGYASAQLVPGPMFTMASYLGAVALPSMPVLGSTLATLAVFLPGALLLFAVVPVWDQVMMNERFKKAIQWVNASVVALLAVALVSPIATSAVTRWQDGVICLLGWWLLKNRKWPIWGLIVVLYLVRWVS